MGIAVLGLIAVIVSFVIASVGEKKGTGAAWALRIGGVLAILFGLFTGTVIQIPAGYQGIRLRFGAVQGTLPPGIHTILPGADEVVNFETRTQKEESKATAASRDLQTVTTSLAVNYHVEPEAVGKLYSNVGADYKRRIIDPAVQESIKVVTAQYTAEDLIKSRPSVKAKVEQDITNRLRPYNLVVETVSITNFDFSPEFNKAIETKQVAQQEMEKQKYVLQQADLQRQTEVTRAQGQAQANRLTAESLKANGGALVIAREWIEKWDGKLPSVSAGGGGGGGNFIIDIQSLMKEAEKK